VLEEEKRALRGERKKLLQDELLDDKERRRCIRRAEQSVKDAEQKVQCVKQRTQLLPFIVEALGEDSQEVKLINIALELVDTLKPVMAKGLPGMGRLLNQDILNASAMTDTPESSTTEAVRSLEEVYAEVLKVAVVLGVELPTEMPGLKVLEQGAETLQTVYPRLKNEKKKVEQKLLDHLEHLSGIQDEVMSKRKAVEDAVDADAQAMEDGELQDMIAQQSQVQEQIAQMEEEVRRFAGRAADMMHKRVGKQSEASSLAAIDLTAVQDLASRNNPIYELLKSFIEYGQTLIGIVQALEIAIKNRDVAALKSIVGKLENMLPAGHPLLPTARQGLKLLESTAALQNLCAEVNPDEIKALLKRYGYTDYSICMVIIGSSVLLIMVLLFFYLGYSAIVKNVDITKAVLAAIAVLGSAGGVNQAHGQTDYSGQGLDLIVNHLVEEWKKAQAQEDDADKFVFDTAADALRTFVRAHKFHVKKAEQEQLLEEEKVTAEANVAATIDEEGILQNMLTLHSPEEEDEEDEEDEEEEEEEDHAPHWHNTLLQST